MTDCLQSKLTLSDEVSALDSTSAKEKLKLGLFSYPVLQAADILLYGYASFQLHSSLGSRSQRYSCSGRRGSSTALGVYKTVR